MGDTEGVKEHILVVVPTLDRWVTESIALFFAKAAHLNYDAGYPYKFSLVAPHSLLGYANMRNRCAKVFLDSPCSRLWFVDADTIFPADIFELPKVDADIVTLPYPFIGTMAPAVCNYVDINDFSKGMLPIEFVDGVADVNGTGMGCTLIRRKVLEDPAMRYATTYITPDGKMGDLADEPDEAPAIFRYWMKPNGQTLQGEDFDFCIRAKRLGYSVKIRGKSQCGHLKTVDLNDAFKRVEAALQQRRADTKVYVV